MIHSIAGNWWCDTLEGQLADVARVRGRLVESPKGMISVLDRAFKAEP